MTKEKKYRVYYTKTVNGYIDVEALDESEAEKNAERLGDGVEYDDSVEYYDVELIK